MLSLVRVGLCVIGRRACGCRRLGRGLRLQLGPHARTRSAPGASGWPRLLPRRGRRPPAPAFFLAGEQRGVVGRIEHRLGRLLPEDAGAGCIGLGQAIALGVHAVLAGRIAVRGRVGRRAGCLHRIDPVEDADESLLDGVEHAGSGFLAPAPLADIVLQQALEGVDALAALRFRRGCCCGGQGCGEPTGSALGGRIDHGGDGIVAQPDGLRPRPLHVLLEGARELAQLLVDGIEAGELPAGSFEVPRQPLDVLLDQLEPRAAEAHRHVVEQAIETTFQPIEASIDGGQRLGWVAIGQRLLQQRGDAGKARLQPGLIVGGRQGPEQAPAAVQARPAPAAAAYWTPARASIAGGRTPRPVPSRRRGSAPRPTGRPKARRHRLPSPWVAPPRSYLSAPAAPARRPQCAPSGRRSPAPGGRAPPACCSGSSARTWPTCRPSWPSRSCMSAKALRWRRSASPIWLAIRCSASSKPAGPQAWDGPSLGRTTGWVLAWSEDDMAVPLGPESAGRGTPRGRRSQ